MDVNDISVLFSMHVLDNELFVWSLTPADIYLTILHTVWDPLSGKLETKSFPDVGS
jgi:hypothetical protein